MLPSQPLREERLGDGDLFPAVVPDFPSRGRGTLLMLPILLSTIISFRPAGRSRTECPNSAYFGERFRAGFWLCAILPADFAGHVDLGWRGCREVKVRSADRYGWPSSDGYRTRHGGR